jgi:hypothetical protein
MQVYSITTTPAWLATTLYFMFIRIQIQSEQETEWQEMDVAGKYYSIALPATDTLVTIYYSVGHLSLNPSTKLTDNI